jgi:hypothetical protein
MSTHEIDRQMMIDAAVCENIVAMNSPAEE